MATVLMMPHRNSAPEPGGRKKLVRRKDRDYSQVLRRSLQGAFLLLNVGIGLQFYAWGSLL